MSNPMSTGTDRHDFASAQGAGYGNDTSSTQPKGTNMKKAIAGFLLGLTAASGVPIATAQFTSAPAPSSPGFEATVRLNEGERARIVFPANSQEDDICLDFRARGNRAPVWIITAAHPDNGCKANYRN